MCGEGRSHFIIFFLSPILTNSHFSQIQLNYFPMILLYACGWDLLFENLSGFCFLLLENIPNVSKWDVSIKSLPQDSGNTMKEEAEGL